MPKTYSKEEREHIIEKLKAETNLLIIEKGVQKTTVDEIVKRTGIPKGTFYLFYETKDDLIYELARDFVTEIDIKIARGIKRIVANNEIDVLRPIPFIGYAEDITEIIMEALIGMQDSCLRVLIDPQTPNAIISRLIVDVTEFYKEYNEVTGSGVLKKLIESRGLKVEDVIKAFYIIILGGISKHKSGDPNIQGSIKMLIKGLVNQLFV